MRKNKILIVLSLALIFFTILFVFTDTENTFINSNDEFAVSDTASITKIFLADKKTHKVLLTKENNVWIVNGKYQARKEAINLLLQALKQIRIKHPVPKTMHNFIIKTLSTTSIKTEIYQTKYRIDFFGLFKAIPYEKLVKIYYVGPAAQDNMGNFMLIENTNYPYVVYLPGFRGFVSPRYSQYEEDWKDHTVFNYKMNQIASLQVEFPSDVKQSYEISNHKSYFQLFQLYPKTIINNFDTLNIVSVLISFQKVNYEKQLTYSLRKGQVDTILHTMPIAIITITDDKGNVNRVRTARMKAVEGDLDINGKPLIYDRDRLYAIIEKTGEIVMIQYFVFSPLMRPLSFFEKKK